MTIKFREFILYQSDFGGFDLCEQVESIDKNSGISSLREKTIGYNMSLDYCINKIIHLIQCRSHDVVDLKGFIESYRSLKNEILTILK
jgi:hypothetical protein